MGDDAKNGELINRMYFYGEINAENTPAWSKTLDEVSIKVLNKSNELGVTIPLTIHICSEGGSAYHGLGLADKIAKLSVPTVSIVEGYVASAATFLSMVADKRLITPNSQMLIHQFSTWYNYGTYENQKDSLENSDKLFKILMNFYKKYSNMKTREIRKLLKRDLFLTAEECLEKGLVDEIL